eukprot:g15047.t1
MQDGTTMAPGSISSSTYGTPVEHSWMFAATSFYAVPMPADRFGGARSAVPSGGTRSSDPRLSGMEVMALPLLNLLLAKPSDQPSPPNKNLFGVLLEPQKVWYKFSFTSPPMPPHSLAFLRQEGRPDAVLFENSRLYTHCLSSPPSVFMQAGMPRHGVRFHNVPGGGEGAAEASRGAPELSLSTLEYYLFTLAWYALSSCVDFYHGLEGPGRMPPVQQRGGNQVNYRPERVALGWRSHGVYGLTRKNPYMTLLQDYMEAFFPHRNGDGISICGGRDGGGGGMSMQCELLLRVLVEFWLEGNTVLRPGVMKEEHHHHQLQQQQQQQQVWGNMNNTEHVATPTPAATRMTTTYDPTIALLWNDFSSPSDPALHGLLVASTHLLADPRLPEVCRRHLGLGNTATAGASGSSNALAVVGGALTPALEVLRPHVFGFLRVAFSPESTIHTSSAAFSLVVELWMLWMRPWAAPAISRGGSPDSTKLTQPIGAAAARASNLRGATSSTSSSAAASARGAAGGASGVDAWINGVASVVKDFLQVEPAGGSASGSCGGGQFRAGSGTARRSSGGGPSASAAGMGHGAYCYDPWGAWVLENYSLYTTLLVAFVRKTGNMSFKVNDGSSDNHRGYGTGSIGHVFADTGGANLRLLYRVTDVFSPDVVSLLSSAQNTVRMMQSSGSGGEGDGEAGQGGLSLSDTERVVLEGGRKAFATIQGPDLVTLERYQDVAEELLITVWDLAFPRVAKDWMTKLEKLVCGPGSNKTTERACKIVTKVKKLFGLPNDWKPKGNDGGGAASGAVEVANMFHPDREKNAPLFLSRQGKAQLVSGRRACKPWDVAYVGDPMYRPQRAWEMGVLISFWVGLSESVNEKWVGWKSPHDDEDEGDPVGFEDEGSGKAIHKGKEFQRRVWREGRWTKLPRRVNLRPLADLRATLGLVMALFFMRLACHVSLSFGAFFALLLGVSIDATCTTSKDSIGGDLIFCYEEHEYFPSYQEKVQVWLSILQSR